MIKEKSLLDRGAEAMLRLGMKEVECQSRKYRAFKKNELPWAYYLGKRGALRRGMTPNSSSSIGTVRNIKGFK